MAFSHINLDAPGTPPGRNDPCPCGSGKKTKRCCGVDRSRFLPLHGRHRGVVPVDHAQRVDQMAGDFTVRFLARTFLPARLGGLSPAALSAEERAELRELFCDQREQVDQALKILERVGYGRPRGRRPRSERAYGQRRDERVDGLVGKMVGDVPADPCAPVAPASPWAPCGPCAPVAPCFPCGPVLFHTIRVWPFAHLLLIRSC